MACQAAQDKQTTAAVSLRGDHTHGPHVSLTLQITPHLPQPGNLQKVEALRQAGC